jgi:hypothetical protein
MSDKVGVGSRLWQFDQNRRVYLRDANGRSHGGPTYEGHWVEHIVTGEEGRSWLVALLNRDGAPGHQQKVGKSSLGKKYYTAAEKATHAWTHLHRHRLADAVLRCADIEVLKRVASIVGYPDPDSAVVPEHTKEDG